MMGLLHNRFETMYLRRCCDVLNVFGYKSVASYLPLIELSINAIRPSDLSREFSRDDGNFGRRIMPASGKLIMIYENRDT